MAANGRTTRSLARHQSAYEDQAREIQKRINTCREAHRDAQEFLQDEPLNANDNNQRKTQLIAQYRANIMQLNQHAANFDAARKEWIELMRNYNIPHEDSEWAASMRRQHDQYYFTQAPHLDYNIRELVAIYRNTIHRADSTASSPELGQGIQPTLLESPAPAQPTPVPDHSDGSNENTSTTTRASTGDNSATPTIPPVPAYSAGPDDSEETLTRQDSDAGPIVTPTAPQPPDRRVRIQEPPANDIPLRDLSLRSTEEEDTDPEFYDAPSPTPVRKTSTRTVADVDRTAASTPEQIGRRIPVNTHQRPSTYGLFAQGEGLFTNATPMAWHNAHTGNGQHHQTIIYGSPVASDRTFTVQNDDRYANYRDSPLYLASLPAAPAAPADRTAYSAAGTAGDGDRRRRLSPLREPSPPRRAASPATRAVHRERLQHAMPPPGRGRYAEPAYASAPPAGRHDESAYASAPPASVGPPAAWTMQPPPSTAAVHYRPPSPTFDHGADFGRENASKFYQNGTYRRTSSTKPPPIVLKENPIPKFSGDIRVYPVFRNRFLETVGGRSDLEPHHMFQHLLQCLDGEPLRLASGYLITDNNYFKVLDRLEERYGNKTKLSTLLTQAFYSLKPAGTSARDLRRFHEEALRIADEMEQIGEDVNGNTLWRQVLLSKIPLHIRTEIYKNLGRNPMEAPVQETLDRLSDYLCMLESSEVACPWMNATEGNSGRNGLLCRADPKSTNQRAGTYATETDATLAANTRNRRCAY